jgi:hypothetical protein
MAGGDPFPAEVRRFVGRHINSVEQLELLLLLRRRAGVTITPEAASRELRTAPGSAAARLEELTRAGLLRREGDAYVYAQSRELDRLLQAVESAYASYRTRFISMIFDKPAGQLRDFADAFRLRKDG